MTITITVSIDDGDVKRSIVVIRTTDHQSRESVFCICNNCIVAEIFEITFEQISQGEKCKSLCAVMRTQFHAVPKRTFVRRCYWRRSDVTHTRST